MSAETGDERVLKGGSQRDVREKDGIVYRSPGPQSPTIVALLRHLEARGFNGAPRVHGTGFATDGRETFEFIEGAVQHPRPWSDDAIVALGELLRALHDATADFRAPANAIWRPHFSRDLPGSDPIIGHGDLGPWNIIAQGGRPAAIIDWDYAGPTQRLWELAQVAWLNVQLHDDDIAEANDLPAPEVRAEQLRLLLDAYGLRGGQREGFVGRIAEYAIHEVRQEAIDYAVTPTTTAGVTAGGYPITWALAWRGRSASWILRHRDLLERAILRT